MGTNFWELLHQRQDQLTRSGHAVADYLCSMRRSAVSLHFLAGPECNVAEATVFRSAGLGFDGYHRDAHCAGQPTPPHTLQPRELQPVPPPQELCEHAYARFLTAISAPRTPSLPKPWTRPYTPDAGGQAGVLPRTGRSMLWQTTSAPLRQPFHQVPHRSDMPFTALTASLMNEADVVLFVPTPARPAT